ncbi:uncharacterized protein LOC135390181 [Ornithodoros turicata]|uniref:uncharacterized protein LOC135390181 n=1 Tax=Ornithodoros turicata TaxID=34597 RepID=UPI00313A06BE
MGYSSPILISNPSWSYVESISFSHHPITPTDKFNGQAENFVRSLKQALRRAQAGKEEDPVGTFLAKYRATPLVSTGKSPCELLNKRLFRMTLDLVRPFRRQSGDVVMPLTQNKSTRNFQAMEKVSVKGPTQKHHWIMGVVLERIGNGIYEVDVEGKKRRRVHADHLKRRIYSDDVPNADVESFNPFSNWSTRSPSGSCLQLSAPL